MFYTLASMVVRLLLRLLTRCRVEGVDNLPGSGPVLLVSNHLNLIDPPVLGALLPRRITFMAKEELFRAPLVGWVVKWYGAFSVRRGRPDREALRRATGVLSRDGVVGMFPEGTRSRTGRMNRGHPGAALVALLAKATIVPVAITGTELVGSPFSLLRRPAITVRVGKPFNLEKSEQGKPDMDALTSLMMSRVAALLPEERRGFYADAARDPAIPSRLGRGVDRPEGRSTG
ncbi:MAG: lysophospholipid acyltransferase family protein [Chloroflexota bacterium]